MRPNSAIVPDTNEVARKMEYCAHCGAGLVYEGYLRYWSECRPGPSGWPISVKVCRDCRGKWPQEDDTHVGK